MRGRKGSERGGRAGGSICRHSKPRAAAPAGSGAARSWDGSEGSPYTLQSIEWSADSRKIAAVRVQPGYQRFVRYVESSPTDQLQPKYMERFYAKPGDVLDPQRAALFNVDTKQ